MTNPQDKAIEAAAKALWDIANPDMTWEDAKADPAQAAFVQWDMECARHAIAAYEREMWREPVAWRYKSEAPGGHSEWSVTQRRADLDTLSKKPFMRVEPLYALPTVPEGE